MAAAYNEAWEVAEVEEAAAEVEEAAAEVEEVAAEETCSAH